MSVLFNRVFIALAIVPFIVGGLWLAMHSQAGTDVKANSDGPGSVQNEPRIAHDFFHNAIVVAYNDGNGSGAATPLGISFSMDGGLTWIDRQLTIPQDPFSPPGTFLGSIFDPYIAFGPPDNVYAGYIARPLSSPGGGNGPASGLYIERTVDGGATWTGPTMIAANPSGSGAGYRFNDRPTMHVSVFGQVAVTWIKDVGVNLPTSDIYYTSSQPPPTQPMPGMPFPPTGLNFAVPLTVNDGANGTDFANVPDVEIHPSGATYVAWINVDVTVPDATTAAIKIDKTIEPGPIMFGTDIPVISIDPLPKKLSTSGGSGDDARAGSYPVIALDEADGSGQTIYMAYAATPQPFTGDESNIYFIKSTDGGMNWSAPLRLNDDTTSTDQYHPAIDYRQSGGGGVIVVVWYDKRNCANDNRWDVYMARSADGGATFGPNRLVSDVTFNTPLAIAAVNPNPPPPLLPPEPWMGEYLGVTLDLGANAHFSFTSSRNNDANGNIFYDRMPSNAVKPADLDDSGGVGVLDLLTIINNWGRCTPCQSCIADVDRSGAVGVTDLLAAINQWG